jgi:hypothetical protein
MSASATMTSMARAPHRVEPSVDRMRCGKHCSLKASQRSSFLRPLGPSPRRLPRERGSVTA